MFGDIWRINVPQFRELDWVRQMVDDLLQDFEASDIRSVPRGTFPLVNVGTTADAVRVYVFAPGVDPKDLDVSIQNNVLIMRGKREFPAKSAEGGGEWPAFYRRERFGGEFSRAVALPERLNGEAAEARARNGMLEIKLPKREEVQPRRIEITAN